MVFRFDKYDPYESRYDYKADMDAAGYRLRRIIDRIGLVPIENFSDIDNGDNILIINKSYIFEHYLGQYLHNEDHDSHAVQLSPNFINRLLNRTRVFEVNDEDADDWQIYASPRNINSSEHTLLDLNDSEL